MLSAAGQARETGVVSVSVDAVSDRERISLNAQDVPMDEIIEVLAARLDLVVKGRPIDASAPLRSYRQSGTLPAVLKRLLSDQNYVLSSCGHPRSAVCREQIHFLNSASLDERRPEKTAVASPAALPQLDAHQYGESTETVARRGTNDEDEGDGDQVSSILKQRADVMRRPRKPRTGRTGRTGRTVPDESPTNDEEPVAVDPVALMNDPNIRRYLQQTTQQATTQLDALVDGLQRAGEELALSQ